VALEIIDKPFVFLDQRTTNVKVHNLSSHVLSSVEQLVLSKNVKFIPTPKGQSVNVLSHSVNNHIRNIRIWYFFKDRMIYDDEYDEFKIKFHIPNPNWDPPMASTEIEQFIQQLLINTQNYIHHHQNDDNKAKLNLSPTEFQALKSLISNTNIVIKPSDKNAGITIMNRTDFISEAMKHLNNSQNYNEISNEQSQLLIRYILELVNSIFSPTNYASSSKPWFDTLCKYCINNINNKTTSTFYVLPKVHKTPFSTRPILACHSALLQNFSAFLAFCLQPFVEKTQTYIKNSRNFLKKLRSLNLNNIEEHWLVSGDIDSMYPNIELNLAFETIMGFYQQSKASKALSKPCFAKLLRALLNNNLISFNNKVFQQISGLPMGSSAAPPIAILVVDKLEQFHLNPHQPIVWCRYIDDIFCIFNNKPKMEEFLGNYNKMHPKIKVNWKIGKLVEYLDVSVSINGNNELITWPFQKPMSIFQYIPFQSFHKPDQKLNWISAELERFWFISSNLAKFKSTTSLFFDRLRKRGYPSAKILEIFKVFELSHWKNGIKLFPEKKLPNKDTKVFFLKMEFNPTWQNFKLGNILPLKMPGNWKFQISWSNSPNLGKKLIKAKLPKLEVLPSLEHFQNNNQQQQQQQ